MDKLQADFNYSSFSSFYPQLLFALVIGFLVNLNAQISYNVDPSVLKDPSGYKLRSNDRIRVVVRGEPECTVEETISNDGTVNLLYIGDSYIVV